MQRLTTRNKNGKAITKSLDFQPLIDKLARYEDIEERCIEKCKCGLHILIDKYKDFIGHLHELAKYWELEKKNLLLKPKIAIDTNVYMKSEFWGIIPYKVCSIHFTSTTSYYIVCAFNNDDLLDEQEITDDDIGKNVFLTEKDAISHEQKE